MKKTDEFEIKKDDIRALSWPGEEVGSVTEDLYGVPDIDGFGGIYRDGCHPYNLHDQEGDSTNTTESGGLYDEAFGPRDPKRMNPEE